MSLLVRLTSIFIYLCDFIFTLYIVVVCNLKPVIKIIRANNDMQKSYSSCKLFICIKYLAFLSVISQYFFFY